MRTQEGIVGAATFGTIFAGVTTLPFRVDRPWSIFVALLNALITASSASLGFKLSLGAHHKMIILCRSPLQLTNKLLRDDTLHDRRQQNSRRHCDQTWADRNYFFDEIADIDSAENGGRCQTSLPYNTYERRGLILETISTGIFPGFLQKRYRDRAIRTVERSSQSAFEVSKLVCSEEKVRV